MQRAWKFRKSDKAVSLFRPTCCYDQTKFQTDLDGDDSGFQHDAFTALEYAYIGARYEKTYQIDAETIAFLAQRVERLLALVKARCLEKIAVLGG